MFSQIRPAMCCGSHQDVIYFHLYYFWIPASISFNWKKSEKVGIRNVSHKKNGRLWRYKISSTNVLILLWREIYRQTKHCDVTHVCRSSACVLCSFAHSDMIIILVSTEMKVGKWTTIVVKMRLFEIVVKTWMSLNSDISLYPQQRAGAQVCFHLTPGCGIMFHSDSWASPIMSQEAQRTQEWRGENLCQFRAEWLKKCLSFRSGILASCASHFDNERRRAQLSPCHRSCPTSTSFCGFPSPECVYLLFTHIIMTRINTNDAV